MILLRVLYGLAIAACLYAVVAGLPLVLSYLMP
jgi:hypothetical protein